MAAPETLGRERRRSSVMAEAEARPASPQSNSEFSKEFFADLTSVCLKSVTDGKMPTYSQVKKVLIAKHGLESFNESKELLQSWMQEFVLQGTSRAPTATTAMHADERVDGGEMPPKSFVTIKIKPVHHKAHPHKVCIRRDIAPSAWSCDACGAWKPSSELIRWHCIKSCDWDVCEQCMSLCNGSKKEVILEYAKGHPLGIVMNNLAVYAVVKNTVADYCSVILPGDRITHIDDHALLADEDFQEQLRIHAEAEDRTGFVKVGLTEPYPFRPRDKKVIRRDTVVRVGRGPSHRASRPGQASEASLVDALAAPTCTEDPENHRQGKDGTKPNDTVAGRAERQPVLPGLPGVKGPGVPGVKGEYQACMGARYDTWQVPDPSDIISPTSALNAALATALGEDAPPPPLDGEGGDEGAVEVHANIELEIELLERSIEGFDLSNPDEAMMVPILEAKVAELRATAGTGTGSSDIDTHSPKQQRGLGAAVGSPEQRITLNLGPSKHLEMSPGQAHGPVNLDTKTIELALASHAAAKAGLTGASPRKLDPRSVATPGDKKPSVAVAAAAAAAAAAAVTGDAAPGCPLRAVETLTALDDDDFCDDAEPIPSPHSPEPLVVSAASTRRVVDVGARLRALSSTGPGLSVSELTALARELGVHPAGAGDIRVEQCASRKPPAATSSMDVGTNSDPVQAPEQTDISSAKVLATTGDLTDTASLESVTVGATKPDSGDSCDSDGDSDGAVPGAARPVMEGTKPATTAPPVATEEASTTRPSSTVTAETVAALPTKTTTTGSGNGTATAPSPAASGTDTTESGDAPAEVDSDESSESTLDRTGASVPKPDAVSSVADPAAKRRLDLTQEQSEAVEREADRLRSAVKVAETDANRAFLRLTRTNGELARVEKLLQEALLDRAKALDSVRELEIENGMLEARATVNRQTIVNQVEDRNLVLRQLEDARDTINKLEALLGVTTPTQWNRSPTQSKQQNVAAPKVVS